MNSRRYRRRALAAARRAVIQHVLVYVLLAAVCAAFWAWIAALVLRLSGIGVLAFGAAMFCATLLSVMVVCNGNVDKEAF